MSQADEMSFTFLSFRTCERWSLEICNFWVTVNMLRLLSIICVPQVLNEQLKTLRVVVHSREKPIERCCVPRPSLRHCVPESYLSHGCHQVQFEDRREYFENPGTKVCEKAKTAAHVTCKFCTDDYCLPHSEDQQILFFNSEMDD